MAYEKYIKKDGKLYGPYIYHSRRIDGKVVSEYHGQKKKDYVKFLWIIPLVLLIILGAYFIGQREDKLTGYSVLDLNANYQEGQALDGKLKVSLQEGELIPASSVVVFENAGQKYEYPLKDLVSEPVREGDFFVRGKNVSGFGEGFGLQGEKEIYPEVQFVLIISSEAPQTEQQQPEETQTETPQEPIPETPTEPAQEESSGLLEVISNLFLSLTPTGNVITESEKEVQGSVSSGNTFTYTLQEGERAELKHRSVRTASGQLSEDSVLLTTEGNLVSVSTNYSEKEEGFGSSYSGEKIKELRINLNELNLLPEKGELKVGIFYEGEELVSMETVIGEGQVSSESEIIVQEKKEQEQIPISPIIPTNNETVNATDIIETEFNITIPELELTGQEISVLEKEFGNISLQVKEEKIKNGFIIIRYELREDTWVNYSYSSDLDNSTLNLFMQQDRIKWLKDLAKKYSA